jgi:hypothetical protein
MTSEWLKVMLDEIARKQAVADAERLELERRRAEQEAAPPAAQGPAADDSA